MTYLLDVNVLIALIDPAHVAHDAAHAWFEGVGHESWATCPLTENGVIRIVSHPKYPNSPGSPGGARTALSASCEICRVTFSGRMTSALSISPYVDTAKLLTAAQVTDTYLLALARSRGGRLATFDRRLSVAALKDGKQALALIGNN